MMKREGQAKHEKFEDRDNAPAQEELDATAELANEKTNDGTNNLRPFSKDGPIGQAGQA